MRLPKDVLAATWVPFVITLVLELVACICFVQYFSSRKRRECGSLVVCILALLVALLSSSLLPADIFLVSYSKDSQGDFKSWASTEEKRQEITDVMQYTYYCLYGLDMLFVFIILPFFFFYNQNRDQDDHTQLTSRCMSALKWTVGFVIIALLLLFLGAILPLKEAASVNGTNIADLKWIIPELGNNKGENSIALVVNIFTSIGVFFLCYYGAYGLAAMPVSWIFGKLSLRSTRDDLLTSESALRIRIESARKRGATREANRLESDLNDVRRELGVLERMEAQCCANCSFLCRPFQLILGLIFFALSLFIVAVIITTNVDRILNGEGYKYGYVINGTSWPNPIDWVLEKMHVAFPIEYVAILCLLMYIVLATVSGIVRVGIRLCCVELYRIRPRKTKPEALLFLVYILMFAILAVNVLFYSIAPGYYTYGTQHWSRLKDDNSTLEIVKCAEEANSDECTKTVSADLLLGYFYKMWVFGMCYYWANWLFVGCFLAGLIVRCARGRSKATDAHFERGYDSEDDNELSDDNDPLLPAYRP